MSLNIAPTIVQNADTWNQDVTLKFLDTSGDKIFMTVDLAIACNVSVSAATYVDNQGTPTTWDAYLIGLNLSLKPSKEIRLYRVTMRVLDSVLSDATGPDPVAETRLPSGRSESYDNDDMMMWVYDNRADKWIWTTGPESVTNISAITDGLWIQTQPDTLNNASSYTTSSEVSMGASVGFEGESPTASLDSSYTLSDSKTVEVVPVNISNQSGDGVLDIRFSINDGEQAKGNFQPYISGIFQTKDDGNFLRSMDPNVTGARAITVELIIWALPQDFAKHAGSVPTTMNLGRNPNRGLIDDPDIASGLHGSTLFALLCSTKVLDWRYTSINGSVTSFSYSPSNASNTNIVMGTQGYTHVGDSYILQQTSLDVWQSDTAQEVADKFAETYSRTVMGAIGGALLSAPAGEAQSRSSKLVAKIPKGPLACLLVTNFLLVILGLFLTVRAFLASSSDVGDVQARLGITALVAAHFEADKGEAAVEKVDHMFQERNGGDGPRVTVERSVLGGWKFASNGGVYHT
ncbi:hypothetical protein FAGAP_1279 [Fusarium agapanthi]|uniref:Uncharacterized protein n=1 Tax=Fusarium agapanthi TaxID=1803897 RepID=A0A9P5BPF6_9HYPO|nr:hypothetical protein FAGAP_1279 [Fusarium agapanthi]